MDNRPLSPHLTVYKPQITSVTLSPNVGTFNSIIITPQVMP